MKLLTKVNNNNRNNNSKKQTNCTTDYDYKSLSIYSSD